MTTSIAVSQGEALTEYRARYGDRVPVPTVSPTGPPEGQHPGARAPQRPGTGRRSGVRRAQRHARWVLKHLDEIEERNRYARPPQWISGESMRYLGRRYVLKVTNIPNNGRQAASSSVDSFACKVET
ncbi:YgjP-like metallopeptidase domain-containing protein [Marinimicrobium locisalis]|uniref:YgjP-like metallopeptidase domain-containing protein n=1 Tax=Marinimicrobium locisalis TaxID=546022 RepID=UPI0032216474